MEISLPGDKMIVNFSDTHAVLADMASQVQEPTTARHVLLEAVSAVHHLCDQYDYDYEELLAEAVEFYRIQQESDLMGLDPEK
jgi:hypothetical protein